MNAPWNEFPDIPFGSIGWRMGFGEVYMINWMEYYTRLSQAERQKYIANNPVPENWPNWYQVVSEIEKREAENDAMFEEYQKKKVTIKKPWWRFWN